MRLRFGFILISLSLVSACAIVEPLSGGERDENAPVPNMAEMSPLNGSTNFNGKEISIPFDEFISLNNPSENIVVIPPDIKPKAKIQNKTLVLSWEEDLRPNTTYSFYLNSVVQDLNEKNDSLMSFVFSTGSTIDSLTALFETNDAFGLSVLPGQTVGLYESFSDSILPNYFGKTDKDGKVILKYMKSGNYDVVAFTDQNKNLKPEANESFGFKKEKLILTDLSIDTNFILISPPYQESKVTTVMLVPPSTFIVGANRSLEEATYYLNGELLSDEHIYTFSSDSVLLPFQWSDSSNYELIVASKNWSDTTGFRMQSKDKDAALKLSPNKTDNVFPNEPIGFMSNHLIDSLNVPSVLIVNTKDSSNIPLRRIKSLGANIELDFVRKDELKNIEVIFLPSAIISQTGTNVDTLRYKINVLTEREIGSLEVKLDGFSSALVIDLLKNGKLEERIPLRKGIDSYVFTNLLPGEYTFRLTVDKNENGRWDGGNWLDKTLPEEVKMYSKPNRVRGNWDTEITLQKDGI